MPIDKKVLEEAAAYVGRRIARTLPTGVGFAFFVFDFGANGNIAYVSNAERDDMIAALQEFIAKASH